MRRLARKIIGIIRRFYGASWLFMSFLLGRCSYDKFRAYIRGRRRWSQKLEARRKGIKFEVPSYNGKKIHDLDEANRIIADAIESGQPFMAGRYGSAELDAVWRVRDDGKGFIAPVSRTLKTLCSNAGFFPEDKKLLPKFAELMKWSTSQIDLVGLFFSPMEEWIQRNYADRPEYCRLHDIDPFIASNPWSAKLEDKKVVIIHPFKDTIESQYKKRKLLFPGRNVLPEFQLRVVKAVQTIAGSRDERFRDWFEALEYMYDEAMKEDFDVAIIGCGAYGFPLAAKIKHAGKIAIHMGGVTQLLFGIKGSRWENEYKGAYPEMMKNPAWVRPSESEKPEGFKKIEGGCYW